VPDHAKSVGQICEETGRHFQVIKQWLKAEVDAGRIRKGKRSRGQTVYYWPA